MQYKASLYGNTSGIFQMKTYDNFSNLFPNFRLYVVVRTALLAFLQRLRMLSKPWGMTCKSSTTLMTNVSARKGFERNSKVKMSLTLQIKHALSEKKMLSSTCIWRQWSHNPHEKTEVVDQRKSGKPYKISAASTVKGQSLQLVNWYTKSPLLKHSVKCHAN